MTRAFLHFGVQKPVIDLTAGLISYWQLADYTDATGNGYTLTGVNTPTFSTGKVGNAIFTARASSQYAKIANASAGDLKLGSASFTSGFTIAGWVYADTLFADFSFSGNAYVASGDPWNGSNLGFIFGNGCSGFGGGNKLGFTGNAGSVIESTTALTENAWNFVAFRWSGGNGSLFVNGTTAESTAAITWSASTRDFNLGAADNDASAATCLDGALDEIGVWNKALSDGELAAFYNSGTGDTYPFT